METHQGRAACPQLRAASARHRADSKTMERTPADRGGAQHHRHAPPYLRHLSPFRRRAFNGHPSRRDASGLGLTIFHPRPLHELVAPRMSKPFDILFNSPFFPE